MLTPKIEYHKSFVSIRKRKDTKYIVIHCAATQNKPEYDWKTIDQIHRQRGFLSIGYHFVIKTDGTIQNGRDIDAIGSHATGFNDVSLGVCLIGGIDRSGKSVDNFTPEQKKSLKELIVWLLSMYPDATLVGHRDLPNVAKDCPCFEVHDLFKDKMPKFVTYKEGMVLQHEMSNADFIACNGEPPYKTGDVLRVA